MVLITTGLMGAVYAFAFVRTATIYAPIAMHLGWNVVRSVVFSDTVLGEQLFVEVKPAPVVQVGYVAYYTLVFGPMLAMLVVGYWVVRRVREERLV